MGIVDRATPATVASYIVVITAAIVVVATVAPFVLSAVQVSGPDQKQVAVITLRGSTDDGNVNAVRDSLREARQNESIAAVVLRIDSSGGPVDSSEEFYLAVNRTAREMPVVAYVQGVAASGGYYGIVPADEIIVKPSSTVGSVGVIVSAPLSAIEGAEQQGETFVRSGPDKAQVSRDQIRSDIETLQSAFVGTVMRHRGEDLSVPQEEVENADVYLGATAVENGFADRIGDSGTAIQRAASLSDEIQGDNYGVTYDDAGADVTVIVLQNKVERVEGDFVYVNRTGKAESEFVQPVKYWAVWGVPRAQTNGTEVVTDG
ncbi:S49 family peptidase [Halomicroarcula sp. GCM10025324]|uniref:S49 family peptidase n=1 Tax=Haloarcula TaxID=2237 RepID=UPI0023E7CFFF|nr:S49 family peptidase [Halomicroarcula sp. ZS-22-S1]